MSSKPRQKGIKEVGELRSMLEHAFSLNQERKFSHKCNDNIEFTGTKPKVEKASRKSSNFDTTKYDGKTHYKEMEKLQRKAEKIKAIKKKSDRLIKLDKPRRHHSKTPTKYQLSCRKQNSKLQRQEKHNIQAGKSLHRHDKTNIAKKFRNRNRNMIRHDNISIENLDSYGSSDQISTSSEEKKRKVSKENSLT